MYFYRLDEGFKGSSYLTETLLDPELGHSFEPNKTPFNKALNFERDMWTWFEAPENKVRLARFGAGMNGAKNMTPADSILEGLVTPRCISPYHSTFIYRIGRVWMGKPPSGFASCRCWRGCWLAILGARSASPAPPLRCPGS